MPVAAVARQPRRLNAEDGPDCPSHSAAQQAFKTGTVRSRSRDSEILIDDIDVLPTQCAGTIDQGILAPLAFQIVPHLIGRGLADVDTGPPGQVVSGDLVHRRPPPCGSSWPAPASTAPELGGVALARPAGDGRRERRGGSSKSCCWRFARDCGIVVLLVHIVHKRGQTGLGDAMQFEQHPNRQARSGDDPCAGGLGTSHPGRHRQRPAIVQSHDIVDLVVKLVLPDHGQALRAQRMKAVVNGNFSRALLMGSMSFSCSRR